MAKRKEEAIVGGLSERAAICKALHEDPDFRQDKDVQNLCKELETNRGKTVFFILKKHLGDESRLSRRIIRFLINSFSIWLPKELYARFPILFPYAVRNPRCRQNKTKTRPEVWGLPNPDAYMLDDNTLLKNFAKGKPVRSGKLLPWYSSSSGIDGGYVAAHVWRATNCAEGVLASRLPYLNTFVGNIAWLPAGIASLTDPNGLDYAQSYYQSLANNVYREVKLLKPVRTLCEQIWACFPMQDAVADKLPDVGCLATFDISEEDIVCIRSALEGVIENIKIVRDKSHNKPPYVHKRYNIFNLAQRNRARIERAYRYLEAYQNCISGFPVEVPLSGVISIVDDSIEYPQTIYVVTKTGECMNVSAKASKCPQAKHMSGMAKVDNATKQTTKVKGHGKDVVGNEQVNAVIAGMSNAVHELAQELVMAYMVHETDGHGAKQSVIFRTCGFSWGDCISASESQQQYWVAAIMQTLCAAGYVTRATLHGPWVCTALGKNKFAKVSKITKDDPRINKLKNLSCKCVLSCMGKMPECAVAANGVAQRAIFVQCGMGWGDRPCTTESQQSYWGIGLLYYLAQCHKVMRVSKSTRWRLA